MMTTPRIVRRHQHGVSIVTAIFLLVVLSVLGTAIVSLSASQHKDSVLDLLGSRAYEAARSGMEYGLFRRLEGTKDCPASVSFNPTPPTMSSFTVTVTCNVNTTTIQQTTITATACNQPSGGACPNPAPTSPDYVQRVVTVQF